MNRRFDFFWFVKNLLGIAGLIVGSFVVSHLIVTSIAVYKVGPGSSSAAYQAEIFSASSMALSQGLLWGGIVFSLIAVYSKPIGALKKICSVLLSFIIYFSFRGMIIWALDAVTDVPTVTSLVENRNTASTVAFIATCAVQGISIYLFWIKRGRMKNSA
jgi:hypothetical protein